MLVLAGLYWELLPATFPIKYLVFFQLYSARVSYNLITYGRCPSRFIKI